MPTTSSHCTKRSFSLNNSPRTNRKYSTIISISINYLPETDCHWLKLILWCNSELCIQNHPSIMQICSFLFNKTTYNYNQKLRQFCLFPNLRLKLLSKNRTTEWLQCRLIKGALCSFWEHFIRRERSPTTDCLCVNKQTLFLFITE